MTMDHAIYVSRVSTTEWEPDPDVGGLMHVLCTEGRMQVGLTRYDEAPDPVPWTLPEREAFLILEGRARIDIEGAASLDLGPGDFACLPQGAVTTWHVTTPFREFWVLAPE